MSRTLQSLIADYGVLCGLTGNYGQDGLRGILIDHVALGEAHGLKIHVTGTGRHWATDGTTAEAVPVVCGEIVWIDTEDGRIDGRCGAPLSWQGDDDTPECPRHGALGSEVRDGEW